jgi:hypothetical protein
LQHVARPYHGVAHLLAVDAVGGDEGDERDDAGVAEQLAHLADAPDVLRAVLVAEPQVYRRKLKLKAKFESGSSYCSFKR